MKGFIAGFDKCSYASIYIVLIAIQQQSHLRRIQINVHLRCAKCFIQCRNHQDGNQYYGNYCIFCADEQKENQVSSSF